MSWRSGNRVYAGNRRSPRSAVPFWRLALVVIGFFWVIAACTFVLGYWIAPAVILAHPSKSPSGIDYGQAFDLPLARSLGVWGSLVLLVPGPAIAAWYGVERALGKLLGKALGADRP